MSTLDRAKQAMQRITSDVNGFAVNVDITNIHTGEMVTVPMLHTKHHLGIDTDGVRVNSRNAHISFSEKLLNDAGVDIRNVKEDVSVKRWKVSVSDSTGVKKNYVIRETFPDETLGLIVCVLDDYQM